MSDIRKAVEELAQMLRAMVDIGGDCGDPTCKDCVPSRKAEAAIASALAAVDAAGWRPIETAPKDGTHVLAWFPEPEEYEVMIVRYWADGELWMTVGPVEDDVYPTHWMPLPAAPGRTGDDNGSN